MEVFEYNGIFYHIPRDPHEVREIYVKRAEFAILIIKDKIEKILSLDMDKIIIQSRIWSNMQNLNCEYPDAKDFLSSWI